MKKMFLFLLLSCSVLGLLAAPGDTTIVQTISFSDMQRSCRSGKYLFPDGSQRYEKVLMLYKIKCFPSPIEKGLHCGEWDYIYYTELLTPLEKWDTLSDVFKMGVGTDTLFVRQSLKPRVDTLFNRDTIPMEDTVITLVDTALNIFDTVINLDTLINIDTIIHRDTITMLEKAVFNHMENYYFVLHDSTLRPDTLGLIPAKLYNRKHYSWSLGSYITPYGGGIDLGDGWTWVYDVTDFIHLLKDSVIIRDCNGQELLDLKFMFIEGTPLRDVVKIQPVTAWTFRPEEHWGGYKLQNFDLYIRDTTFQLDPNEKQVRLKMTVTGHDMAGPNAAAEFSHNIHKVIANGQVVREWDIIQSCSDNPLHPQGGTWVYDRAGWCPGMNATTNDFELTPYIVNNSISFDYDITYDTYGSYRVRAYLVTYGDMNNANDAAMEDIIAPTDHILHSKVNPICGKPIVSIKNIGANPLTSVKITYGIMNTDGSGLIKPFVYQWTGNLPSFNLDTVMLPIIDWMDIGDSTHGRFMVTLSEPNGSADPTPHNNTLYSTFKMPVKYTNTRNFQVEFQTNQTPGENSWTLSDAFNNVLYRNESPLSPKYNYVTNIPELADGCYRFIITDSEGDGLYFFAREYKERGHLILKYHVNGPVYFTMPDAKFVEFGKFAQYDFAVGSYLSVEEIEQSQFRVYPNPAQSFVTISPDRDFDNAEACIYDIRGILVHTEPIRGLAQRTVSLTNFSSGLYVVILKENGQIKGRTKFVVNK